MAVSDEILQQYEMTIGIECHVQLATKTKLFSPADNDARNAEPNEKTHEFPTMRVTPQRGRRLPSTL